MRRITRRNKRKNEGSGQRRTVLVILLFMAILPLLGVSNYNRGFERITTIYFSGEVLDENASTRRNIRTESQEEGSRQSVIPTIETKQKALQLSGNKKADNRPIPSHSSKADDNLDSFGACLKIKDDNHWLVEWLAYHWFVLPLRHLIVYVDPTSKTDPRPIFDRWHDKLKVQMLNDNYTGALPAGMPATDVVLQHRGPQHLFMENCMRTFKRQNWTSWVVLIDTDEFLSISPNTRDPKEELYRGENVVPGNHELGSVMKFLKQESRAWENDANKTAFPDCLLIFRGQICDVKATPLEQKSLYVPPGFHANDFLTTRWLKRGGGRFPKDMVNIGAIDADYFEKLDLLSGEGNIHHALPGHCTNSVKRNHSLFQVYHYNGSSEQKNFRDDIRGKFGKRQGQTKPELSCPGHRADDLAPWLKGFVELVGQVEARRLLEGAGRIHSWPAYLPKTNEINATAQG